MVRRLARSALLGALALCSSAVARAQGPADAPAETPDAPRTGPVRREVVVGVAGPLDPESRATLFRLLRAELEPHGAVLVERDPSGDARAWAREVTQGDERLLGVLLDTTGGTGWRLVVVDAARGRAISRELPGGAKNAANVEAVVSIVLSATNALHEGLEVASAPLETVVGTPPAPVAAAPAPRREPPPVTKSRGTSLHAGATAVLASFAEAAEPTFGGSLALGASIGSLIDVDLAGSLHAPQTVESDFGSFALGRSSLSLRAGPVLKQGAFSLVPALGVTGEWIVRSKTRAASGVAPGDGAETTPRVGGELGLAGRYALVEHHGEERVSVLATLSSAYFGEEVRFLAGDEAIATVRSAVFGAGLGVFIATDSL